MRNIPALWKREMVSYFFSPIAYIVMAGFLLINGLFFWEILNLFNHQPNIPSDISPMQILFGGSFPFWVLILIIPPVLTMRLFAEEMKSGTIEVLLTAPVTDAEVVLGKYLGALSFYALLWLPTVCYVLILAFYGSIEPGPILAGYLGVLLLGALFLSVGVFTSALTSNQVIAAVFCFAVLVVLFLSSLMGNIVYSEQARSVLEYISFLDHMSDLNRGIVNTKPLAFYVSFTVFCLFLTVRVLETRRWR
jgi:ABC-2 type transport system permease protein